jgi:hypothetical protein
MKSVRLTAWLLASLCAFAGSSCHHKNSEPAPEADAVQVSYAQTSCADKWGQASTPQLLETVATTYLTQQGIALSQAQATRVNQGAICNACMCPTGVVLVGTVPASQLAAILALGFTKR